MQIPRYSKQKLDFNICPNALIIRQGEEKYPKCQDKCRICFGKGIISGKTLEYVQLRDLTSGNGLEWAWADSVGCIYCGLIYRTKGMELEVNDDCSILCIKCRRPTIITSANPQEFNMTLEKIRELKKFWFGN